ncbi:TIGR03086 family metal-binding protein [Mycobacterium sp. DL592]|uniref:TIGR03086 family metal-binding protein n=1 Tax=Mycobacterium sp. DL592 TaxID=2675524 RepID=UPI00141E31E9|nr:TIGR03086 family metal-binding protein [Mycobacterium sp. DL592]
MHTNLDILPLHRIAVAASVDAVAQVNLEQLGDPTPCAEWNLAELIAHMIVQNRGFAAAARGQGADLTVWDPTTVISDVIRHPLTAYAESANEVLDAFAGDGVLDIPFALPELGPDATFPASMAIGFHFVDSVVHGWDVSRASGQTFELPDDVLTAVLPLALAVPGGSFRTANGSSFQPAITTDDGANGMDQVLAYLGRSPGWTPR